MISRVSEMFSPYLGPHNPPFRQTHLLANVEKTGLGIKEVWPDPVPLFCLLGQSMATPNDWQQPTTGNAESIATRKP